MAQTILDETFWAALDRLVAGAAVVIDRPKASRHPRYPDLVYPLDYGYLAGTTAIDGGGVDIWVGSQAGRAVVGIVCTVDLVKADRELKILLGCRPAEIEIVRQFHNSTSQMKGAVLVRPAPGGL